MKKFVYHKQPEMSKWGNFGVPQRSKSRHFMQIKSRRWGRG